VKGPDGEERVVAVAAPGTIPPTVNPPSNVVIAAAPPAQPAATAAPALTQPASPSRSNSIVARAPAQPAARPAQTAAAKPTQTASASLSGLENFLSKLFTTQDSQASTAGPASPVQAARPSGLRGSTTTAESASAPVAKPKPAPGALAEAKPRPLPEPEEAPGHKVANAAVAMPPHSPVSAFNGPPAAARSGLLSGAAPVIPAGSFGDSWLSGR